MRIRNSGKERQPDSSKQLIADIRALLWVVTVGGLALAAYCIRTGYTGALPWLTAMVGLPWTIMAVKTASVYDLRPRCRNPGVGGAFAKFLVP